MKRVLIPLRPRTKKPDLLSRWQERAPDDPMFAAVFDAIPSANVGVRLDELVVVDLDSPERVAWWRENSPTSTLYVSQGRPGREAHWYTLPEDSELVSLAMADWQVKVGPGQQQVVPPSIHPDTGKPYRWLDLPLDAYGPPPPAPVEFILANAHPEHRSWAPGTGWRFIPEGSRDNALTSMAGMLRRYGASEEALVIVLQNLNSHICNPPLDNRELSRIARSVARYDALPDEDFQLLEEAEESL